MAGELPPDLRTIRRQSMTKNSMEVVADAVGIARMHGIDIAVCRTPPELFAHVIEEISARARRAKTDVKKLEQLAEAWTDNERRDGELAIVGDDAGTPEE